MVTPERRAEIEKGYHVGCVRELLAEIDRLNKVVDQAIDMTSMRMIGKEIVIIRNPVPMSPMFPELAAELERRG